MKPSLALAAAVGLLLVGSAWCADLSGELLAKPAPCLLLMPLPASRVGGPSVQGRAWLCYNAPRPPAGRRKLPEIGTGLDFLNSNTFGSGQAPAPPPALTPLLSLHALANRPPPTRPCACVRALGC